MEYGSQGVPLGTVPIIPYNTKAYAVNIEGSEDDKRNIADLYDFHPLKVAQPIDNIELGLLRADPFFLVSRVLTAAAVSWNMLLNVVAEDLEHWTSPTPDSLEQGMQQLNFNARLIDKVLDFIAEQKPMVRDSGSPSWPTARDDSQLSRKTALQAALLSDLSNLEGRCRHLARKCEVCTGMLVSTAQLAVSEKSIDQARQVQFLTQLAFIFVPAGFISSMFGMNVAEFKNNPSIWIFFLVAVICSVVAWVIVSWKELKLKAAKLSMKFRRKNRFD